MRYISSHVFVPVLVLISALGQPGLSRAELSKPTFDRLACLDAQHIEAIRADVSKLEQALIACRDEMSTKTRHLLSDLETRLAFSSIAAQAMAPYGNSTALTLKALLFETALDCDNYATLSLYFMRQLVGDDLAMKLTGFDGGAIGNHAQVFVQARDSRDMLVDPTIGLFALTDFDTVLQGDPVAAENVFVFHQHDDAAIDGFAAVVRKAITGGLYKPSDILYTFYSIDEFISFAERTSNAWKSKDVNAIIANYPSPASLALRKTLEATMKRAEKKPNIRARIEGVSE